MRILLLSYHFRPDPAVGALRVSETARRLAAEGHRVSVIAGRQDNEAPAREADGNLAIHRLRPPPKLWPVLARWLRTRGRRASAQTESAVGAAQPAGETTAARLRRWLLSLELMVDNRKAWSLLALVAGLRARREGPFDLVISSGPPHSVHLAARLLAIGRSRWVMDLRDPWVGNGGIAPDTDSTLRQSIEMRLERWCGTRADWITLAAPGAARNLLARHPQWRDRTEVILNGWDGEPLAGAPPAGRLQLMYAGSLYYNRDPFPLLEALRRLVDSSPVERSRIHLLLVGHCSAYRGRSVSEWVERAGLSDLVEVRGPVRRDELKSLLADATVLVNFAQGQPLQIPAKLYEYMASGREMLVVGEPDGDTAELTRCSGTGRVVDPDDPEAMLETLRELYAFYVTECRSFVPPRNVVAGFSRHEQHLKLMELISAR